MLNNDRPKTKPTGGLAQIPGFGGLRSPQGTGLRQGIPESIFSGSMPFYRRTYSPGQLQFITTSSAPGDWPWSSWRFYFWQDASILRMDPLP